jgi:DNA (cytosine-5)-methyltransferase 1
MNELSLFTGAGGGILGTHLLGWRPVGYVEFNDYCQRVLAARIRDGAIPEAPIWGDVRAFNDSGYARRYRGVADVVTAGFPCQPFSAAGRKRGAADSRNMWPETIRTIKAVRPSLVLLENVPGIKPYLPVVFRGLRDAGYCVRPPVQASAAAVGAGHIRERVWIRADAVRVGCHGRASLQASTRSPGRISAQGDYPWWTAEPDVGRVAHGVASRVDRLRALGNGQTPAVVRLAWETLSHA